MDLEKQYNLALDTAKRSECIRRKFGFVILNTSTNDIYVGYNKRIGRCCEGNECIRDRYQTKNGERVELGGEIHAEQMALINSGPFTSNLSVRAVLAGVNADGIPLTGAISFPCHVCALSIAFSGIRYVHMATEKGVIEAVSIWDIIEHREKEWEFSYDV